MHFHKFDRYYQGIIMYMPNLVCKINTFYFGEHFHTHQYAHKEFRVKQF